MAPRRIQEMGTKYCEQQKKEEKQHENDENITTLIEDTTKNRDFKESSPKRIWYRQLFVV